jgi:hypothetical protein
MLTDPEAWFLTSKALDHHTTVSVLRQALPGEAEDLTDVAQELAVSLAMNGYALIELESQDAPVHDLTEAIDTFLNRKED